MNEEGISESIRETPRVFNWGIEGPRSTGGKAEALDGMEEHIEKLRIWENELREQMVGMEDGQERQDKEKEIRSIKNEHIRKGSAFYADASPEGEIINKATSPNLNNSAE